jgi:hypothetical protein
LSTISITAAPGEALPLNAKGLTVVIAFKTGFWQGLWRNGGCGKLDAEVDKAKR